MNGIHDMGGMQGLGEIGYKESAPGFDEPWEIRLFALVQAMRTGGLRPYIEGIPAADYLRMGYYERWYTALVKQIIESGTVTRAEVDSGRADPASTNRAALRPGPGPASLRPGAQRPRSRRNRAMPPCP